MRALTRNPAATILGLLALALGIALAVVLLSDDEDDTATATAPKQVTLTAPAPAPKGITAQDPGAAGRPAALTRGSSALRPKTGGASGQPVAVNVTVEGQIGQWNGQARAYLASASFKRPALVIVQPNGNFGLFAGGLVENSAGQITFVTNSEVFQWIRGVSVATWASRIPAASVSVDSSRGAIQAVLGATARAVTLNHFALGASPRQITAGQAQLTFAGGHVSGTADLYGGPYIGPGNNFPVDLYHATISG